MMILQKSRGISSYLEVSGVDVPHNYEIRMLEQNHMKYILETELREIDTRKTLYVKVDGLAALTTRFARISPGMKDVKKLLMDLCGCIREAGSYLLDAGGLLIDMRYILYSSDDDCYRFLYIPGRRQEFRLQLKGIMEEIMRIFDHSDKEGVVFLYDLYSRLLADNFTPELFLKMLSVDEKSKAQEMYSPPDPVEEFAMELERQDVIEENRPLKNEKRVSDNTGAIPVTNKTPYILAFVIAGIVSSLLYMSMGVKSIKFAVMLLMAAGVYVALDVMRLKEEAEVDSSMDEYTAGTVIKKSSGNYSDSSRGAEESERSIAGRTRDFGESGRRIVSKSEHLGLVPSSGFEESADTSVLMDVSMGNTVTRLVPSDGDPEHQIYLIEGETRVGRQGAMCDICIEDNSISRVHAKLEKIGDRVIVTDLGSTNGTFLNGRLLPVNEAVETSVGDKLSFAKLEYECK